LEINHDLEHLFGNAMFGFNWCVVIFQNYFLGCNLGQFSTKNLPTIGLQCFWRPQGHWKNIIFLECQWNNNIVTTMIKFLQIGTSWYGMVQITFQISIAVVITLAPFTIFYPNLPLYKMKWNNFFSNLLPGLYFNIICKNIMKQFQNFEVGYT
jgi:hypothetical protein